tara:strand:- start:97 stop:246 length:150 start_codon:yes stop_codon:yes gene_type:complete
LIIPIFLIWRVTTLNVIVPTAHMMLAHVMEADYVSVNQKMLFAVVANSF